MNSEHKITLEFTYFSKVNIVTSFTAFLAAHVDGLLSQELYYGMTTYSLYETILLLFYFSHKNAQIKKNCKLLYVCHAYWIQLNSELNGSSIQRRTWPL